MNDKNAGRPCTYMLRCSDGTLYTGWTNDITKRLAAHNAGKGAKYTKSRTPVELVYVEFFDVREAAMRREYAIKQLSRSQKLALIGSGSNPAISLGSPAISSGCDAAAASACGSSTDSGCGSSGESNPG